MAPTEWRLALQRTRRVEKIFSRELAPQTEGVRTRNEQNEFIAAVSKLGPRDDDRRLPAALGLIGKPFSGKTKRVHACESFLSDASPPKFEALHAFFNRRPLVLGQLRRDRPKRLFRLPRDTADVDVKLVLTP